MSAWLPIESIIHNNQKEYYDAINIYNSNGESTVFIEFILSVIKQALLEVGEIPAMASSKEDIRLGEIYEFLKTHEYIMNSDAQNILNVSSATATRILTAFTKLRKLKRMRIESHWGYVMEQ